MREEYKIVLEAKRSLKDHISFMEMLIKHLTGTNKVLRNQASYAAWCIHRYFNDKLVSDIQEAIQKNTPPDGKLQS
jgi:hypothetical protein